MNPLQPRKTLSKNSTPKKSRIKIKSTLTNTNDLLEISPKNNSYDLLPDELDNINEFEQYKKSFLGKHQLEQVPVENKHHTGTDLEQITNALNKINDQSIIQDDWGTSAINHAQIDHSTSAIKKIVSAIFTHYKRPSNPYPLIEKSQSAIEQSQTTHDKLKSSADKSLKLHALKTSHLLAHLK